MRKKWIEGYTGEYLVTDTGDVISYLFRDERVLSGGMTPRGYLMVSLRGKSVTIHRLVAMAFISNPLSKPQVNHKDGNKTNNSYKNLEWVTNKENSRHSFDVLGRKGPQLGRSGRLHHRSKPVIQYSLDGTEIARWESSRLTESAGFHQAAVSRCCNGNQKTHKGFVWMYQ